MADLLEAIPPEHRPLVEQLARLPASERRAVIAAAEEEAAGTRRATIPWEELAAARGIVKLGGDAVEDCGRLHDEISGVRRVELDLEADVDAHERQR